MRPVVIVDPLSSGVELAPVFKARGVPVISVTLEQKEWPEFGSKIREQDFFRIYPDGPELEKILFSHKPLAIIPGTEEGVPLADRLAEKLTPHLMNDPLKSKTRLHKALMQNALSEASLPALKTFCGSAEKEVEDWLNKNGLENSPLVLKPPNSSGSEYVFHISRGQDWRVAFRYILATPSLITGECSESVVIQEQAIGTEYAIGTVSANGKHFLCHLLRYNKISVDGRATVFDYVEMIDASNGAMVDLFAYVKRALDAVGVRWGAAHTEVILTNAGPRLIETAPRMIGGPVVEFARAATGSSQADRLGELYTEGKVKSEAYDFQRTVVPVFLRSPATGLLKNAEVFDRADNLTTLLSKHLWVKNGDRVARTVDYLSSIGIIALVGDRTSIFSDYALIREMESILRVDPVE